MIKGIIIANSIVFLGTGTGSVAIGKGQRSSAGIILNLNSNQLHIDPGIGTVERASACGINLRETVAILLSHSHLNHSNDINAVIDCMTYSGLDKKGVLIANKTALHGADDHPAIVQLYHRNHLERFIAVDRGQKIGINDIEIHTMTARHKDPNTIGFKFFVDNIIITYSSDTVYAEDIADQYTGSHILILNMPYVKKSTDNLGMDDCIAIINKVKPKLAILTHFSQEVLKADPLYVAREVQKATKVQTVAAQDSMKINTSNLPIQNNFI